VRYDGRYDGQDERVTVAEAAVLLGTSKEAVRKRIARGTLRSEKDPDGSVRVYVPVSPTASDPGNPQAGVECSALIEELRDRMRFLEEQLRREQDAHSEARRLVAALIQRVPEVEAPSEPSDRPPSAGAGLSREEPRPSGGETQEPSERVSWWRKVFGG
jgi:excisionase family DNA binding protein